jgi:signal transduction histidine kinase/DNA-binding response OmpR family regulator
VVTAHHGVFYLTESASGSTILKLVSSYAYQERKKLANRFAPGEGLVGQCALEKQRLLITEVPDDYIQVSSGLGESPPRNIVVLPVLFEKEVKAVIELASLSRFTATHLAFLDQLAEGIGIVLNTIAATTRTEELLKQSQSLTEELQVQQEELKESNQRLEQQATSLISSEELLKKQQEELKQTNEELEEKARQLMSQKAEVEGKNREIELAKMSLQERAEQLALTSKYKSEFLANMSHELRTPLNSLLILAEMLADNAQGNLAAQQVEFAKTIYAAGSDLQSLINDILDMAKIESGTMTLDLGELPFPELQQYVERTFLPVAQNKSLDFTVELADDLPGGIYSDAKRLQQVLRNLLSNAFKFTEQGKVSLRVAKAARGWSPDHEVLNRADAVIAFSVRDTGIGIPADKFKIIFEPFQQAESGTGRKYGGTGLGLSISREIARLLGGEIRVTSTVGQGSTFTLYMPLTYRAPDRGGAETAKGGRGERASGKAGTERERGRRGEGSAPRGDDEAWRTGEERHGDMEKGRSGEEARNRISLSPGLPTPAGEVEDDRERIQPGDRVLLIVENDANFGRVLLHMAREQGFKGLVAQGGHSALSLAQQWRPDAITLDIRLPDMDGWKVLEHFKNDLATRHIPIHIISVVEAWQRGLQLGALAYLKKPVNKQTLAETFAKIQTFVERGKKNLLLVEADEAHRAAMVELIGDGDVHITAVGTAEEALNALKKMPFDCLVINLWFPDMTGFELVNQIQKKPELRNLPIVIYTGKDLTPEEDAQLKFLAEGTVIKDCKSPEHLLDETCLFLHRVEANLPESKRRILRQIHETDPVLANRKVLIVDDDLRNIFALTSMLEHHGMRVLYAENGQAGIDILEKTPDIDLVLMDIMMPGMDGYETMRAIRKIERFQSLPIIALTAKAMKGDREKCIEAGASDYIAKPVRSEQVLSLLRVWLYR